MLTTQPLIATLNLGKRKRIMSWPPLYRAAEMTITIIYIYIYIYIYISLRRLQTGYTLNKIGSHLHVSCHTGTHVVSQLKIATIKSSIIGFSDPPENYDIAERRQWPSNMSPLKL
jgi:hypothetical protein